MKIVFLYADTETEYNCSHWRSYLPSTFLKRFCGFETSLWHVRELETEECKKDLSSANIILIERLLSNSIYVTLDKYRANGAKIVFDMDDAYKLMEPASPVYRFWVNGIYPDGKHRMTFPPIEQLEWYVKLVDKVSSPSKLILEDWRPYTDSLLWLPNFADADLYSRIPYREEGKVVIGWGGGSTHYTSWYDSGLITAMRRIYTAYKGKIKLALITKDKQLAHKLREFAPTIIESDRLKYPGEIQLLDIALAPLSGPYDRRRSWLKISEYSLSGIPWIATDYEPYRDYNYPGSILVEKNKAAGWEEAIANMIDNRYKYYQAAREEGYKMWKKAFAIQENHEFLKKQFENVYNGLVGD